MRQRLLAIAISLASADAPAAERTYTVVLSGHEAGIQTVSESGPERVVHFELNDRGRGPKLDSRLVIAPDGTLASVTTTGNDYLKAPVDERFAVEGGKARWKNKAEEAERTVGAPALYVSVDATPEELEVLVQALAKHGGELALLPEGVARLERRGEYTCTAAGEPVKLSGVAVTGLDFLPTPAWLDADGNVFATVSGWQSVIRRGWEGCVPQLVAAQDEASAAWLGGVARAASHRPVALAVRHARVFDPETLALRPGTTVITRGERIVAVGPDASVPVPPDAEVVDAGDRVLLPGLWDMHVHVGEVDGLLDIAAGVTTVRDLANDVDILAALQRAWDAGSLIGPRVIPAGIIEGPGPYAGPTKVLVSSASEGRDAVRMYAKLGYPQVKLYSSVAPELVKPIAAEAHALGMRVSGHVPAFMTAPQAVEAGYDEIQHVNMLFLSLWADEVKDTRTPLRFTAVAEKAALVDLDSKPVRDLVDLLLRHHTVIDPTVSVFEGMFVSRAGEVSPTYAAVAPRLPAAVRRGFTTGGLRVPPGMDRRYRDSFAALLRMVKLLHDRGVTVVAGTDGLAGFTLPRELELYVEAGLGPAEVLRIATLGAARVMKRDADLGSISAGKRADLVLVDGNPLEHMADVRRVVRVVKDGRMYDPAAIEQALGMRTR